MTKKCEFLHAIFNSLKVHSFPFNENEIPKNGIYILFEKGELGHNTNRIVGTHTGNNQLISRLKQHFLNENKDRSIFRKNIGRALLNKTKDAYLDVWEIDLTTKEAKGKFSKLIDSEKQKILEREITKYLQDNFSFVVFQVDDKNKRLELESKIISTVSKCKECKPSSTWLGLFSTKEKIREKGLWQVNELGKEQFSEKELDDLRESLKINNV